MRLDETVPRAYSGLLPLLGEPGFRPWADCLPSQLNRAFAGDRHGDWPAWAAVLRDLPKLAASRIDLQSAEIRIEGGAGETTQEALREQLLRLHPWRKGPYEVHGVKIDTEWRSDLKWDRLAPFIQPLAGRTVLDVGCGSGYHCWRMAGADAARVIGIDPTLLSVAQFLAIRHFIGDLPVHVLPVGIDDVPAGLRIFDTVFSMGILYHRRSPLDHLLDLRGCLRQGGELVLETLVINGREGEALLPERRYAQMRNVWFIPSCLTLEGWLRRCGFVNVRLVNVTRTTTGEQRTTDWMRFQSLPDFLDPADANLTVEGYPAPTRAIFIAESP